MLLIGTIKFSNSFFFNSLRNVQKVQSNLAAILMASTPLTATILAHFFTNNEKINLIKSIGDIGWFFWNCLSYFLIKF